MKLMAAGRCLVLVTTATFLFGCGGDASKPKLGPVSGKVTYNGQPVTKGLVSFVPSSGPGSETGQSASGEIGPDGSYKLTTFESGDGAVLGQHKVLVQSREEDPALKGRGMPIPDAKGNFNTKPPKHLVPQQYETADKTPLRYTVKEGNNKYDIELKD
jgi:hypothetical protein